MGGYEKWVVKGDGWGGGDGRLREINGCLREIPYMGG
jgi:hypothetical protein